MMMENMFKEQLKYTTRLSYLLIGNYRLGEFVLPAKGSK